jgi:hypothetical protein
MRSAIQRGVRALRGCIACAALLGCSACSSLPMRSRAIPDCPGEIYSTHQIPGNFAARERVTVTAKDLDFPFELVVQKSGDDLVLIGLSPLGAKLFSVVQIGTEPSVDALPAAVLPIPPLNVLRDLHRLRFAPQSKPAADREPVVFDHPDCGYSIRFEMLGEEPLP